MDKEQLAGIIERIANNTATDQEISIYNTWCQAAQEQGAQIPDLEALQARMLGQINAEIDRTEKVSYPFYRIAAAAAILLMLSFGGYFLWHKNTLPAVTPKTANQDINPGKNAATLTLANGHKILLANAGNGMIAKQSGVIINKTASGQVVYSLTPAAAMQATVQYNTVSTANGEQYKVVLQDGTSVILNAASSITYPTQFTGNERRVEITGEAYFEVAHNKEKPFRVVSNRQTVEVLGTHFNINAYNDEPAVKTTLIEGAVRIVTPAGDGSLKPGEQSILYKDKLRITTADIEEALAWKNGDFVFKNQTMADIMRTVARWYDIEVSYENYNDKKLTFSGVVSRSRNLSAVLRMMESTAAVKFSIEGKRVRVIN